MASARRPVGHARPCALPSPRRAGTRRGRTEPRLIFVHLLRGTRTFQVRGTILRIPDVRFRLANIRQAAHRPALSRRVVATTTRPPPAKPLARNPFLLLPPDHLLPGRHVKSATRRYATLRDQPPAGP